MGFRINNNAYRDETVREGMGNLSSIMNPTASQNASYQLERKRFLEGNAQEQRNKANQAFATSDSGKRILSQIMGYAEEAGVDLGPLLGKVAWDPNFQQSTAGVRNLSTGKQRQGAYETLMSPGNLPGLPGPDDTQRLGAGLIYTGKPMTKDAALTGTMRQQLLENADQLARYGIDQGEITARMPQPFTVGQDSLGLVPDGKGGWIE